MSRTDDKIWVNTNSSQLSEVLTDIDNQRTMQNFLRDVMTASEIIEIGARLEAAKMLTEGRKYTEITKATKLSSRTIARISEWLKNGFGGYRSALKIISAHHNHISPASAD